MAPPEVPDAPHPVDPLLLEQLSSELDLLVSDALWAVESRQDDTVAGELAALVDLRKDDLDVARAARALQWPQTDEDEAYDEDVDWPTGMVDLAAAILAASATGAVAEGDPSGQADSLEELYYLQTNFGRDEEATRTAEREAALAERMAADDADLWIPRLSSAFRRAANSAEWASGPAAGIAHSEQAMRVDERRSRSWTPKDRLDCLDEAYRTHADLLLGTGEHDAALYQSQLRLNLHERPGGIHYDAYKHAAALDQYARVLTAARNGNELAALPVLQRAVNIGLEDAQDEARNVNRVFRSSVHRVKQYRIGLEKHGFHTEAVAECEREVEIAHQLAAVHQRNSTLPASTIHQVASWMKEVGRTDEAVDWAERAVRAWAALPPAEIPLQGEQNALRLVQECLEAVGRKSEAAQCVRRRALAALRTATVSSALGLQSAKALSDATADFDWIENPRDGLRYCDMEIMLREELSAAGHTNDDDLANALNNRGLFLRDLNRASEALAEYKRSLNLYEPLREAALGEESDPYAAEISDVHYNLAGSFIRLYDYQAAEANVRRAVALEEERAGAEPDRPNPKLARALDLLGSVQGDLRDFDSAIESRRRAVAIYERADNAIDAARVRGNLAANQLNSGRIRQGVATAESVAAEYERLYAEGAEDPEDPEGIRSTLAETYGNLASFRKRIMQFDQSVADARRALELWTEHHERSVHGCLDDLASAHQNLADALAAAGKNDEALEHSRRATELAEQLLISDRSLHLKTVQLTLDSQARALADAGLHEEALEVSLRATGLAEEMVEFGPANFRRNLAGCLLNLGNYLTSCGQHQEAYEVTRRCVQIDEEMDAAEPGMHRQELTKALANLARRHWGLENYEAALEASLRATALGEELCAEDREMHLGVQAKSMTDQIAYLSQLERYEEALELSHRAATLHEERVANQEVDAQTDRVGALTMGIEQLFFLSRGAEAVADCERLLEMRNELDSPEVAAHLEAKLAEALSKGGSKLQTAGKRLEAAEAIERAVVLARSAAERDPKKWRELLREVLCDLAWILPLVGRRAECLRITDESLRLAEKLATPDDRYGLALSLDAHSFELGKLARLDEALELARRAVPMWESRLALCDLAERRVDLGWCLRHVARWSAEFGEDAAEYLPLSTRAVELLWSAAADDDWYEDELAQCLIDHAKRLDDAGQDSEAARFGVEAIAMLRDLTELNRSVHLEYLAKALREHAPRLAAAGDEVAARVAAAEALRHLKELDADLPNVFGDELNLALEVATRLGAIEDHDREKEGV
ncbi:tetratricopeptide repeat protein [Glycomyces buryatensis]|uniref:Tetratricopeptide repeat protein n=1 Tax=Glycomyces buryatensis TaxID=2570927 RepID=A0A4S8QFF5_9ACTN|nr:tetratricopeptide repeat protein [Glycomyces buryatensis]THV41862.1 tetratricopeptide repeat protein [Glycomyces buryatensis]